MKRNQRKNTVASKISWAFSKNVFKLCFYFLWSFGKKRRCTDLSKKYFFKTIMNSNRRHFFSHFVSRKSLNWVRLAWSWFFFPCDGKWQFKTGMTTPEEIPYFLSTFSLSFSGPTKPTPHWLFVPDTQFVNKAIRLCGHYIFLKPCDWLSLFSLLQGQLQILKTGGKENFGT